MAGPVSQEAPVSFSSSSTAPLLPPRCRATAVAFSLDPNGAAPHEVEIGDALAHPQGYAVGFIHRAAVGWVGAVAVLHLDAAAPRVFDLAPTLGDAPPPRLAWRSNELVAAQFALPGAGQHLPDTARELVLFLVEPALDRKPYLSIAQERDDSLAFDLAFSGGLGLVVWDEVTAGGARSTGRGVIRAVSVQADQRGPVRDISPPESDAEAPRVLSDGAGFIVTWLARRPEPIGFSESSADPEATGEARAYGWLEMAVLDAHGNATGPVRRLTSVTGHVSAYDVQVLPPSPKLTMLVVARDDGEAVDGSGGALLRVRAREDGAEPAVAFPSDDLGRGAPAFVDGPAPWLGWVGPREQLRLLPLDYAGIPTAPPSAEDAFDEARPLALFSADAAKAFGGGGAEAGGGGAEAKMLVATPNDPAAALRVFACRR